jgi:uncharacterized protein (DUF433 family)
MPLESPVESIPIREDATGALRVGDTRVLLELVIDAFEDGATPETISQRYDTLALSDVYAVITYYLRHRDEIGDYLRRRGQQAAEIWRKIESNQRDLGEIRRRLNARRNSVEQGNDASGF